jgi:hypothetical protein
MNGQDLKALTLAGMTWLQTNQPTVNALNVFPVPDGDTGTNMSLTMQAAWKEIANSGEHSVGKIAHAIAHGALMGARGNSGVILSQIWRGFARALEHHEYLDAANLAHAMAVARDTAYKGVVRPVEGTILTVIKDVATAAELASRETTDLKELLGRIIPAADASVQRTPDLLPVLRDAGVVDSGGKGLFFLLEGMLRYLHGQPLDAPTTTVRPLAALDLDNAIESIEPGQDYEVVVDFRPEGDLDIEDFYKNLEMMGTSIQVGEGDGMYRMHIHVPTEKRYHPIDYIMGIGTITKVAIENLLAQMEDLEKHGASTKLTLTKIEPGQIAVVAVSPGNGIARVFASLGAAEIIEGGQTMNPSTQEILRSFENLPTDRVIILPNNKNIILAAQQAKALTVKQVAVIPSRSVPQGLAAMMRLAPDGDMEVVAKEMTEAIQEVQTGEITVATRSVEIDGVSVKEGEVIGLLNGQLVLSTHNVARAVMDLLEKAGTDDYELITLFTGKDIQKNEANQIIDSVRKRYPSHEIELQDGGQPHYQFIISIE